MLLYLKIIIILISIGGRGGREDRDILLHALTFALITAINLRFRATLRAAVSTV